MGRRKIEIQPILHDRNRSVTFLKVSESHFYRSRRVRLDGPRRCRRLLSHPARCLGDTPLRAVAGFPKEESDPDLFSVAYWSWHDAKVGTPSARMVCSRKRSSSVSYAPSMLSSSSLGTTKNYTSTHLRLMAARLEY
ncbi:uncharacterized protein EI90DRAFT_1683110 [Cantharellus anzutake]|uniref:uncharacterized protein n=1 Tax=Cantharellus anzutake TaxID=1750568 RepID=UPI001906CD6B|nr:uncharacterized protein EI90DRAFT_1683110 [Cantharellus anzutake]KAF8327780.1 hypothetical protein EI90DRAFT_1683110 [Cantharellus anzutake]